MQAEYCTLCFTHGDGLFEPIEEDARESLILLFPYLDAKTQSDSQVACPDCSTKLGGYLGFRSSFMQTQACVQSVRREQRGSLLDLGQVYLQNEGNGSEVITKDLVVCRFCFKQATGAYTTLVEDSKELTSVMIMMHKCFPGLELGTMSGHAICVPCHKTLEESYDFIRSVDVDNLIKEEDAIEVREVEDGPDLKPMLLIWETSSNGNSCVDLNIVKKEDSFTSNGYDFDEAVEAKVEGSVEQEDKQELNEKQKLKVEAVDVEEHSWSSFEGKACDIKAEPNANESVTDKTSTTQSETTYKSEKCLNGRRRTTNLNYQELSHKKSSEPPMYKCETCLFKSGRKWNYKQHMLRHKRPPKVTIHKCDVCSYETRRKNNFVLHMLIHSKPSEVTLYKCELCPLETNRKNSLKKHMLIHMKASEVTNYKCELCSFVTRHKNSLMEHMLIHKNPSEVTMYKCAECSYETKRKGNLKVHMRVHKQHPSLCRSMTDALT